MTKKSYTEFIFLIFLGAATSLSLPPFNYIIINFITLSLLFAFLIKRSKETKNKKIFFFYGWLFGFGYFITNLYWISISLTFDEDLNYLIPLAILLIPSFLALFYGLISFVFNLFNPKNNIEVAKLHSQEMNLNIKYIHAAPENLDLKDCAIASASSLEGPPIESSFGLKITPGTAMLCNNATAN